MRAFVGSLLVGAEAAQVTEMSAALVDASEGRLRAVPDDTLHLTYAFIGELPEARIEHAARAIEAAVRGVPATPVVFGAPHILYGGREARLVLLPALEGGDWLASVARGIADALAAALPDVAMSSTPAPHVTIARFRRGTVRRDANGVATMIEERLSEFRVATTIESVQLFESRLRTNGPEYMVRHASVLVR